MTWPTAIPLSSSRRRSPRIPPRKALYFQRVFLDGAAAEFCVANWPETLPLSVVTRCRNGQIRVCQRRVEGDLLIFRTPDDWDRGGFECSYESRFVRLEPMPREEAERAALCNRVSVSMGG